MQTAWQPARDKVYAKLRTIVCDSSIKKKLKNQRSYKQTKKPDTQSKKAE